MKKENDWKKFSKRKRNSNTMIFENLNVKNSKTRSSTTYYTDNTISLLKIIISKYLFNFESFLEKKDEKQTKEKALKKKEILRKRKKENR